VLCTLICSRISLGHRYVMDTPSSKMGHPTITGHVTEFLNQHLAGRWIGHGGFIPWPPPSPYLTLLDLFPVRILERHYHTKVNNLPDLHCRITSAVVSVTQDMLRSTWRESRYRFVVWCTTQEVGFIWRSVDMIVNLSLCMFHDKPLVCILIKNGVIQCLYQLLSFLTLCIKEPFFPLY
jgi:hypothetical protein